MSELALADAQRVAEEVAREAGALVMEGYRAGTEVHKKGAIDLLTEYDLASEQLILRRLRADTPGVEVVAEEAHGPWGRDSAGASGQRLTWFVDPIDGTTNYAHGHPFFGISLGLCRGSEPLVGVVYAPALGVLWSGRRGAGCSRDGSPCAVSSRAALADALLATGFPYDRATSQENNFQEFLHFKRLARGVRRCGAASLDLALVADGTYDGYWECKLSPWDLAAGAALVLAAGGRVTGYDGQPPDLGAGCLVASNGPLHEPILRELASARLGRPAPVREA